MCWRTKVGNLLIDKEALWMLPTNVLMAYELELRDRSLTLQNAHVSSQVYHFEMYMGTRCLKTIPKFKR